MENSVCLMLAASLHTPISLDSVFDELDLQNDGIKNDYHITIAYDESGRMTRDSILGDVRTALGSDKFYIFDEFMKDSYKFKVNDVMYLDVFSHNDNDFVVLRLRDGNSLYSNLQVINEYLRTKYEIDSEFSEYKPHLTLAKLKKSEGSKYLNSTVLNKVLNDSKVGFEDIVYSEEVAENKYSKWNITTHHALTRYFRETRVD